MRNKLLVMLNASTIFFHIFTLLEWMKPKKIPLKLDILSCNVPGNVGKWFCPRYILSLDYTVNPILVEDGKVHQHYSYLLKHTWAQYFKMCNPPALKDMPPESCFWN